MQKFGEMCITTFKDNTHRAKLANWGTTGIWVGWAENHPTGTYRIFNPKAKWIILTRDVTFLQKSYGEYSKVEKPVVLNRSYEGSDDEKELEIVPVDKKNNNVNIVSDSNSDSTNEDFENNQGNFFDKDINNQVIVSPETTVNAKVIQAMKKLQALYNNDTNKIIKEAMQVKVSKNLNFLIDLAMVITNTMQVPEELVSFNEAWNHPNTTSEEKWRKAICKEFANMNMQ